MKTVGTIIIILGVILLIFVITKGLFILSTCLGLFGVAVMAIVIGKIMLIIDKENNY